MSRAKLGERASSRHEHAGALERGRWGGSSSRVPGRRPSSRRRGGTIWERPGAGRASRFTWVHKLAATVGISLLIAGAMVLFRDTIAGLGHWGYLGAFVVSALSSATLFLPAPGAAFVLMMAPHYQPVLLGIAAGLGTALGSLTAYYVGAHAGTAVRHRKAHRLASRLMRRLGPAIVFSFALVPLLPMDAAGIVAGAVRFPLRKFLVYTAAASAIKMTALVYGVIGSLGWLQEAQGRWIPRFFP